MKSVERKNKILCHSWTEKLKMVVTTLEQGQGQTDHS